MRWCRFPRVSGCLPRDCSAGRGFDGASCGDQALGNCCAVRLAGEGKSIAAARDAGALLDSPRMTTALATLKEVFGYDAFRGEQGLVVDTVCAGRDALVIMPTGGGKSLCYQLPALLRPGLALVVSPLIALMQDQVAALRQLGVRAAYLNSTLEPWERQEVEDAINTGTLDLLYIAPERLLTDTTLALLGGRELALIAIDEAHCVSAWGHDFRVDYLELHRLRDAFPGVPRIALTATADQRTRDDIVERLALDAPVRFIAGFDRPNIRYSVQPKTDAKAQLLAFLQEHRGEAGIVYCLARRSVESTADWLNERGFSALPYHAGLPADMRASHQARFQAEDGLIVVATIAFGMGIDKPDVRFVAHLDLPKSVEAYYQETGRAGRDGQPAEAWMIYGLQDVVRLSQLVAESSAGEAQKRLEREKLDALLGWCEVTDCRRRPLLAYFGEAAGDDCGNCDNCLQPPETWDGTTVAQKALSCVYRTGQRFGAGHVIDVLRGQRREKVLKFDHDQLSTFGIGAEFSDQQWRAVFRQLVVRGFLFSDAERYGALRLTEKSRAVLRGETTVELRALEKKKRAVGKVRAVEFDEDDPAWDPLLWDALRDQRRALAEAAGVPPYVVFHDATLKEMVRHRPRDAGDLLAISGVGAAKLERYGEAFLAVLNGAAVAGDATAEAAAPEAEPPDGGRFVAD